MPSFEACALAPHIYDPQNASEVFSYTAAIRIPSAATAAELAKSIPDNAKAIEDARVSGAIALERGPNSKLVIACSPLCRCLATGPHRFCDGSFGDPSGFLAPTTCP